MKSFTDSLNTRYEAVLQSSSDPLFYQNIHRYIDYIVKNPPLAEIMDKAEKQYHKRHGDIWFPRTRDEKELEKREQRTVKFERFNLYSSHYVTLKVRIYDPLEDYKTSDDDDKDQDPVALLMLKGIKNIRIRKWMKESKNDFDKWSPRNIKSYNRWYEGERKYYENELRQFHVDFLGEVEKLENDKENILPEPEKIKLPLYVDELTGDFTFYKMTGNFPFGGKEFLVITALCKNVVRVNSYLFLIKSYNPNVDSASKAQKDDLYLVIRDIKKRLNISSDGNPDIFKNIKNRGYRLVFPMPEVNTE